MKETIKSNCIVIILSIVIMVASFVIGTIVMCFGNSRTIGAVVGSIILASICAIVVSVIGIFRKKRANRALEQLAYHYNYYLEYEIYKRVGRTKKDRFVKRLKKECNIDIPIKYTAWRDGLLERNRLLKDNEDFYHFLKYESRAMKNIRDCIAIIVTPLEIGVMTVFLSDYMSEEGSLLKAVLSACVLLAFLVVELIKSKNEIAYVEDVVEVLCPKYCK